MCHDGATMGGYLVSSGSSLDFSVEAPHLTHTGLPSVRMLHLGVPYRKTVAASITFRRYWRGNFLSDPKKIRQSFCFCQKRDTSIIFPLEFIIFPEVVVLVYGWVFGHPKFLCEGR